MLEKYKFLGFGVYGLVIKDHNNQIWTVTESFMRSEYTGQIREFEKNIKICIDIEQSEITFEEVEHKPEDNSILTAERITQNNAWNTLVAESIDKNNVEPLLEKAIRLIQSKNNETLHYMVSEGSYRVVLNYSNLNYSIEFKPNRFYAICITFVDHSNCVSEERTFYGKEFYKLDQLFKQVGSYISENPLDFFEKSKQYFKSL